MKTRLTYLGLATFSVCMLYMVWLGRDDFAFTIVNFNTLEGLHRLKHADQFLPYFQKIRLLPHMKATEAAETCDWGDEYPLINFMYGEEEDWVQQVRPDGEIDFRRNTWHRFLEYDLIPWKDTSSHFSGHGAVVLAGNHVTVKMLEVLLRMLGMLRSNLDVEVHHWGPDEINNVQKERLLEIRPEHLYFHDLSDMASNVLQTHRDAFLINYQLKTAAVINSRFAEVLLIDSDNTPWITPETLFESKTYKEYGTVFWPDIARTRPQNPMWAITSTSCRMDEYEQESGQLLVDKRRYWYHLQLAAWFNSQPYYNDFLLGDKDMFRFAWHALKTPYGRPTHWLSSVGVAQRQRKQQSLAKKSSTEKGVEYTVDYSFAELVGSNLHWCGHSFAQHHPDTDEIAFIHGGLLKTQDKAAIEWNRATGGLFRHVKRSTYDTDPSYVEPVRIFWDHSEFIGFGDKSWDPQRKASEVAMCTEMDRVRPERLDPSYEEAFEKAGGYWMLDTQS